MSMKYKFAVCLIFLVLINVRATGQASKSTDFNRQYEFAGKLLGESLDSLNLLVSKMKKSAGLTQKQQAKLDRIRSKVNVLNEINGILGSIQQMDLDAGVENGNIMGSVEELISQSRPDEAIPLILKFMSQVNEGSDSSVYAAIYLADAYRQKREYEKGISMLYKVLGNSGISVRNKAFAYNRMAALQSEKEPFEGNKTDSIRKYSRRCIQISEKNDLALYLALSENELGYNYFNHNMYDSALVLIFDAARIFQKLHKIPNTINAYLNLSYIYGKMGKYPESRNILLKALDIGNVEENRNLFRYAYYHLANVSYHLGDPDAAFEYLMVAYDLMIQFYNDRIELQINQMSAQYDLKEKEAKIKEEAQKSRTYWLQLNFLFVIFLITTGLLMTLIFLYRFKNRTYKKLAEQNLKALKLEKQAEHYFSKLTGSGIKSNGDNQPDVLAMNLKKFMIEEKPYLWSDVSLEIFCKKLNTNRTYLSKLINDHYQMGFYDLLFEYRIRTAVEFLNNTQLNHISVEGIGEMAGFKSNSNFYKRFKKSIGMTPMQFREQAKNLDIQTNPV